MLYKMFDMLYVECWNSVLTQIKSRCVRYLYIKTKIGKLLKDNIEETLGTIYACKSFLIGFQKPRKPFQESNIRLHEIKYLLHCKGKQSAKWRDNLMNGWKIFATYSSDRGLTS